MSTTIYQQPWLTSSNFSYPRPLQADTLNQQKPERTHMYANKVFVPRRQCSSWSAHERKREWETMQMGGEKKINLLINTSWLKRVGRIIWKGLKSHRRAPEHLLRVESAVYGQSTVFFIHLMHLSQSAREPPGLWRAGTRGVTSMAYIYPNTRVLR